MKRYATILSIAGSDSIGGAGIQADIKTASHFGVYAMTAITAVTAQNTCGVKSFEAISPELLAAQIDSVVSDVRPDAVKIGMLPNIESIKVVADAISHRHHLTNVVLDPVMVATSGDALTHGNTTRALIDILMPHATIIIPNIPEAETLLGRHIQDPAEDLLDLSKAISKEGSPSVGILLKGGHATDQNGMMIDRLFLPEENAIRTFSSTKTETPNTHGTGCSLSTAIACGLAQGKNLFNSVLRAKQFISSAISAGSDYEFGHGHGPIYFF